jgi:DNA-binding MarR family transcriptional regulator
MRIRLNMRKLEENGFVLRGLSPSDSRATNVRFTAQGKKFTQKTIVAVENADEEFFPA